MKKGLFSILLVVSGLLLFSACDKSKTELTIRPSMTAAFGVSGGPALSSLLFDATTIQPIVFKSQYSDTQNYLQIVGEDTATKYKVILYLKKYKATPFTYSVSGGSAAAVFVHGGIESIATSGQVTIKEVTGNTLNGYFNFATVDGYTVANGTLVVGKPWDFN